MVVRLWPPSIQWLWARNWNCPSAGSALTASIVADRRSRSTPLTVLVTLTVSSLKLALLGLVPGMHSLLSTIGRTSGTVRTVVLTCQHDHGHGGPAHRRAATPAGRRRTDPGGDPAHCCVAGDHRRTRGPVDREPGCRDRHQQKRPLRHFGSKQELQLATVEEAERILTEEVVQPALAAAPGLGQLAAACEAFFSYVERRVFPGGCFFAATALEMGTRPGPVKERLAAIQADFTELLRSFASTAIEQRELPAHEDPDRLAFELHAILLGADTKFVLHDDPAVLDLARRVVRHRLALDDARNS